jgi:alpha-mannosidase
VSITPLGLPLTTIKRAEDANGFVFRCCDYAGAGGKAKVKLPATADEVFNCNLVETDERTLNEHGKTISAPLRPYGLLTLKARFPEAR